MADTINDVLIPVDTPIKLRANEIYALPSAGNQVSWQSATGSDLLASIDRVTFGSLGVSIAAEVKTVFSSAAWIKTTSSDTWVITKVAPISVLSPPTGGSGGGAGAALHPDGTSALPGIAFTNEPDLGFYRPSLGVSAFVNNSVSELSINGNTHVVALDNLSALTRVAIGAIPAQSGSLRLVSNGSIMARNAGNTADINLIQLNGADVVTVGGVSITTNILGNTIFNGEVSLGPNTFLKATERVPPPAPPVDTAYIWLEDNGSGLSRLVAGFNTGIKQIIAQQGGLPITTGGPNPPQTGAIRLSNNESIVWRNFGSSGDIPGIKVNTSDKVEIATSTVITTFPGAVEFSGQITSSAAAFFNGGTTFANINLFNGLADFANTANFRGNLVLDSNAPILMSGNYIRFGETAGQPAAPPTNSVNLWAQDDGAGNTKLMVLFPTGAAVPIAWQGNLNPITTNSFVSAGLQITSGSYISAASYISTAAYFSAGSNPATVGIIRIPNNQYIASRNAANTADIIIAGVNAINQLVLGSNEFWIDFALHTINVANLQTAGSVFLIDPAASVRIGATPALSGSIRMANSTFIKSRDANDLFDITLIGSDTTGRIIIGEGTVSPLCSIQGGIELTERPALPVQTPPANRVYLYAFDNGAGKTQLVCQFSTGAYQVLATEA